MVLKANLVLVLNHWYCVMSTALHLQAWRRLQQLQQEVSDLVSQCRRPTFSQMTALCEGLERLKPLSSSRQRQLLWMLTF